MPNQAALISVPAGVTLLIAEANKNSVMSTGQKANNVTSAGLSLLIPTCSDPGIGEYPINVDLLEMNMRKSGCPLLPPYIKVAMKDPGLAGRKTAGWDRLS
jgi:hypothetical protein